MTAFSGPETGKNLNNPHYVGPLPEDDTGFEQDSLFAQPEEEPRELTKGEILGFMPRPGTGERSLGPRLLEAYEKDPKHGVGRTLSFIARNPKGGRAAGLRKVIRSDMITPYRQSQNRLNFLEGLHEDAEELGVTVFEDDQYEDFRRDIIAEYLEAKQMDADIKKEERVTFRDFLQQCNEHELLELIDETSEDLQKREAFWGKMIEIGRRTNMAVDQIASSEGIPRIDSA